MPYRASLSAENGPRRPRAPGSSARCRQPHVVEVQLALHRRPHRALRLEHRHVEARRVGRHDEAADAVVGLRPHDRDLRDRGEADPALRAGQDPVVAVAAGERLHARRVGARTRARSGRSSRSPRRAPSAAATPASAPRCPSGGSTPSRASPAPTRTCGCPSRPPRARARRGRTRRRCGRGIRSPRGSCPSTPSSPSSGTSSAGKTARSNQSAMSGRIRSSTKRAHPVAHRALVVAEQRVDAEDIGCRAQRLEIVGVPRLHAPSSSFGWFDHAGRCPIARGGWRAESANAGVSRETSG